MSLPVHKMVDIIHHIAHAEQERGKKVKVGYVTSFNRRTYAVKVRLEPESSANEARGSKKVVETNWIPLSRPFGGHNWGMLAPPKANPNPPYGDMVVVIWPDGGHGMALGPFYNDKERAPDVDVKAGELLLLHKDGASVKILNDGSVILRDKSGSTITFDGDGSVKALSSDGGSVELKSGGDVLIQSGGGAKVSLEGSQVKIN